VHVTVTGSSRLDVYKRGGDSLLGRYFLYRMHPLSVGELLRSRIPRKEISPPAKLASQAWENLRAFGGFPEPFMKAERRFHNRWKRSRFEQVLREDLRDLTRVQELSQIELLARILEGQAGQTTTYSALAEKVRVSVDTIRRWVVVLESLYFCFVVRPWSKNVAKSLVKEPKIYLYDWSTLEDEGFRSENLAAVHLLKAVQLWTDLGFGEFSLHYLRDKLGREVDFLVARDKKPWFLVEVKTSGKRPLHGELYRFQDQTGAAHAFQLAMDLPYADEDCFSRKKPVIVPGLTLLSQLP
jgi:predicted AAA+ superfamily ATPase